MKWADFLEQMEAEYYRELLISVASRTKAAKRAKLSRQHMSRMMDKHNLQRGHVGTMATWLEPRVRAYWEEIFSQVASVIEAAQVAGVHRSVVYRAADRWDFKVRYTRPRRPGNAAWRALEG